MNKKRLPIKGFVTTWLQVNKLTVNYSVLSSNVNLFFSDLDIISTRIEEDLHENDIF